eukprot:TRINITY_DN24486_c0_g2_i1.p1 TRINITY_DN24486_c0_g2~~TRINITY_DN24486_c0_g2_i1.p1  ORF type:complete len:530 (+),score=97.19 TRINITY_DN24486_c0_g2_i1:72-1661(+)
MSPISITLSQDRSTSATGGSLAEFLLNRLATKGKPAHVPAQHESFSPQRARAVASPARALLRRSAWCAGSRGSRQSFEEVGPPADNRGWACLEPVGYEQAEVSLAANALEPRTRVPQSQHRGRSRTPKRSRDTGSELPENSKQQNSLELSQQPARRSKVTSLKRDSRAREAADSPSRSEAAIPRHSRATEAGESPSRSEAAIASISAAVATAKRAAASVELRLARMTAERAAATVRLRATSRQIEALRKEATDLKATAKMVAASPKLALYCMSAFRSGISDLGERSDDEQLTRQEAKAAPVLRRLLTEQARSRSRTPEQSTGRSITSAQSKQAPKEPLLPSSKDERRQLQQSQPIRSLRSQEQASVQQQQGRHHVSEKHRQHQKENKTRREQFQEKQPRSKLAQMLEDMIQSTNSKFKKSEHNQQRRQVQLQQDDHHWQQHQQHQHHKSTIKTSTTETTTCRTASCKQLETAMRQQQGSFQTHSGPSLLKRRRSRSPAVRDEVVVSAEKYWFPDFGSRLRLRVLQAACG